MASHRFHVTRGRISALAVGLVVLLAVPARVFAEEAPAPAAPGAKAEGARDESLDAAFGLRWFDSKAEVESLGVDLRNATATQFGDSYATSYLPRLVPDMNYAVLSFGYNDQLIRITAVGGEFENDNDARQVRNRYRELKDVLTKKYGEGKSEEHIEKPFDGALIALGFRNKKNWMYTVFQQPHMRIELSVIVLSGNRTRWRLIFENFEGMAQLQRERRSSEEAAF